MDVPISALIGCRTSGCPDQNVNPGKQPVFTTLPRCLLSCPDPVTLPEGYRKVGRWDRVWPGALFGEVPRALIGVSDGYRGKTCADPPSGDHAMEDPLSNS